MSKLSSRFARAISLFTCALVACLSTIAVGQSTFDLDPPKIVHSVATSMTPGKPLRINAKVTDDTGVDEVMVHYRVGQSGAYQSISMMKVQGDEYTALITTSKDQKSIRYYIEATDSGGNRVVEASPQSPLVVNAKKKSNTLYILLGAVAVGALIGAGGGGGGGPDPVPNPTRVLSISAGVPD